MFTETNVYVSMRLPVCHSLRVCLSVCLSLRACKCGSVCVHV